MGENLLIKLSPIALDSDEIKITHYVILIIDCGVNALIKQSGCWMIEQILDAHAFMCDIGHEFVAIVNPSTINTGGVQSRPDETKILNYLCFAAGLI